jgi:hypothetical protein
MEDRIVIGFGNDTESQGSILSLGRGVSETDSTNKNECEVGCFHLGERTSLNRERTRIDTKKRKDLTADG